MLKIKEEEISKTVREKWSLTRELSKIKTDFSTETMGLEGSWENIFKVLKNTASQKPYIQKNYLSKKKK